MPSPPFNSDAYKVSADGELIVGAGSGSVPGEGDAATWDAQRGWRSIYWVLTSEFGNEDVIGWYLAEALDVSADGQTIVGWGYSPQGFEEGWVAFIPRPLPCPADVNGDRFVDLSDVALMLSAFGATPSNSNYSLACDIDRSGVVELGDLAGVLAVYGNACP